MNKNEITKFIFEKIKDNNKNYTFNTKDNDYNQGYTDGYTDGIHDAFVDILNFLKVEHNEEYYN